MNQGMNTAMANQQAIAGGARGAGALALAGGNMAGNNAAMQSQAFNQGGQLRAQEMATARDQYGNLSTQHRGQDQSRIGQTNDMSKFNAGQTQSADVQNKTNDITFRGTMGNLATGSMTAGAGAINAGSGALNTAMHPHDEVMASGTKMQGLRGTSSDTHEELTAGIVGGNADRKANRTDSWINTGKELGMSLLKK
jgi:hypothetical protein